MRHLTRVAALVLAMVSLAASAGGHEPASDHATACVGTAPLPGGCGLAAHSPATFGGGGSVSWSGAYTGRVALVVNGGAYTQWCSVVVGVPLGACPISSGAVPLGVPLTAECRSYSLFSPSLAPGGVGDFRCTFTHS